MTISSEWLKETYLRYHNGTFTNWPAIAREIECAALPATAERTPLDALPVSNDERLESCIARLANHFLDVKDKFGVDASEIRTIVQFYYPDRQPASAKLDATHERDAAYQELEAGQPKMDEYERGWQSAIEAAAQHVPLIMGNEGVGCVCGWRVNSSDTWVGHIRSLRLSPAAKEK